MAKLPAVCEEGRTVRRYPLASGQSPLEGAAVYLVTGEVTICGADPSVVMGFMLHDSPGSVLEIDPYNGDVLVAVAKPGSTFWVEGSTAPADYSAVGGTYGAAHEATTEVTYLDLTETTANVFVVEDVDLVRGLYLCSILAATRQLFA